MLKSTLLVLLTTGAIISGCAKPAPAPASGEPVQDEKGSGGGGGSM